MPWSRRKSGKNPEFCSRGNTLFCSFPNLLNCSQMRKGGPYIYLSFINFLRLVPVWINKRTTSPRKYKNWKAELMLRSKPDASLEKYKWSNALRKKKKGPQQKQKEPKIRSSKVYVHYNYALNVDHSSSNTTLFYGHLKGAIHMSKSSFQIYIYSISFWNKELDRSVRGIYSYCVGEQPDPMVSTFNLN